VNEADDKAFDEYLRRTGEVSRRYRELSADEVPAAVDERVLAEARAAVRDSATKSKARAWQRWAPPLALAASLVLVTTIMLDGGMQKRAAPTSEVMTRAVQPIESPASAPREDMAPPPAPQEKRAEAPSAKEDFVREPSAPADAPQRRRERNAEPEVVRVEAFRVRPVAEDAALPVQVLELPEPKLAAPAAPAPELKLGAPAAEAIMPASNAGPRGTIPAGVISAGSSTDASKADRDSNPSAWLEHIRELRAKKRDREADREWARFREAFPNYTVAETDKARPRKP
jgi:hypothetical protein